MLNAKCKDEGVRKVIVEMLDACGEITEALRSALVTVEGSANTFGDAQLSVDVIADEIMWEVAKGSEVVAYGASEEEPEIVKCNPKGEYTICWDPLDGSSIVDNNWAVGTIIGVFVRGVLCPFFRAPRRRRGGVTAAPPVRHRRNTETKNTRAGGARSPARATTACWAPRAATRSLR